MSSQSVSLMSSQCVPWIIDGALTLSQRSMILTPRLHQWGRKRGPTRRGPTRRGRKRGPTRRGPTWRGPTRRGPTQQGRKRGPTQLYGPADTDQRGGAVVQGQRDVHHVLLRPTKGPESCRCLQALEVSDDCGLGKSWKRRNPA